MDIPLLTTSSPRGDYKGFLAQLFCFIGAGTPFSLYVPPQGAGLLAEPGSLQGGMLLTSPPKYVYWVGG